MKERDDSEGRKQLANWRGILDIAARVAVIMASIAVIFAVVSARLQPRSAQPRSAMKGAAAAGKTPPALPAEPIRLDQGRPTKGNPQAKVAVIEYSDFQCAHSARFVQETLPALEQKYFRTRKVLFAFQQLPLRPNSFAQRAAEGAECANRQGRFWEMHDLLFAKQKQLDERLLLESAQRIGLNAEIFAYCLDGEAAPSVTEQVTKAKGLGISGTPTFFVGTVLPDGRVKVAERLTGAQPLERFEEVLDGLLQSQVPARR